jgi:hypothetical protein
VARRAYVSVTGDDDLNAWIHHRLDYEEARVGLMLENSCAGVAAGGHPPVVSAPLDRGWLIAE